MAENGVLKGRYFDRSVILLCVRWYSSSSSRVQQVTFGYMPLPIDGSLASIELLQQQ